MTLTRTTRAHTVTRVSLYIDRPASQVLDRLHSSISTKDRNGLEILNHLSTRSEFESATDSYLGPHEFMHFATIDHSQWIQLYGIHEAKSLTRIVFGNPQIAITLLEHDVSAGLFAPVEALVVDLGDDRGTEILYIRPSDLMLAGRQNAKLEQAASKLDDKLEKLWEWVAKGS